MNTKNTQAEIKKVEKARQERKGRLVLLPIQEFIKTESFGGILLLISTAAALILANSAYAETYKGWWQTPLIFGYGAYNINMPLHFWINDVLMAIFFFVVGLEIKREIIAGELSTVRKAAFPAFAALGGMIFPAIIYLAFNLGSDRTAGWGIPTATDIAFTIGIMSLLGSRIPFSLKLFITALAIVDDLGAVVVIALFYTSDLVLIQLLIAGFFLLLLIAANRMGIQNPVVYGIFGFFLWLALLKSGVHPTIGGVLTAMTIPARTKINPGEFYSRSSKLLSSFKLADSESDSILANQVQESAIFNIRNACSKIEPPILGLEHMLHPWVTYFIMPLFAFSNAGVSFVDSSISFPFEEPVTLGVIFGLVLGKPLGISIFTWLSTKSGLASKPSGVRWPQIFAVSIFGGVGFTMSIFIASLAFNENVYLDYAKTGILVASVLASALAVVSIFLTGKLRKPKREQAD